MDFVSSELGKNQSRIHGPRSVACERSTSCRRRFHILAGQVHMVPSSMVFPGRGPSIVLGMRFWLEILGNLAGHSAILLQMPGTRNLRFCRFQGHKNSTRIPHPCTDRCGSSCEPRRATEIQLEHAAQSPVRRTHCTSQTGHEPCKSTWLQA